MAVGQTHSLLRVIKGKGSATRDYFNLVGTGHAQTTRDMADRGQSPDGNKRPRYSHLSDGQRVPFHEVAHHGEQLQSHKA